MTQWWIRCGRVEWQYKKQRRVSEDYYWQFGVIPDKEGTKRAEPRKSIRKIVKKPVLPYTQQKDYETKWRISCWPSLYFLEINITNFLSIGNLLPRQLMQFFIRYCIPSYYFYLVTFVFLLFLSCTTVLRLYDTENVDFILVRNPFFFYKSLTIKQYITSIS